MIETVNIVVMILRTGVRLLDILEVTTRTHSYSDESNIRLTGVKGDTSW
jgi:hypothetical protein